MTTEEISTAVYNIKCLQGETFQRILTYKDSAGSVIDITNYTARMKVKKRRNDTTATISLTSSDGIVIVGASGTITINITDTVTSALEEGTYYYDLEIESSSGFISRIMQGTFEVIKEITD